MISRSVHIWKEAVSAISGWWRWKPWYLLRYHVANRPRINNFALIYSMQKSSQLWAALNDEESREQSLIRFFLCKAFSRGTIVHVENKTIFNRHPNFLQINFETRSVSPRSTHASHWNAIQIGARPFKLVVDIDLEKAQESTRNVVCAPELF